MSEPTNAVTMPTEPAALHNRVWRSLALFAADIKIAHSVFALPFAASAFVIGALPLPTARQTALLLVCMVCARSFAMGMNRYLDRAIDAENPRTKMRKIPVGALTPSAGLTWSLAAGVAFAVAAAALSPLAGRLSVPLLLVLMTYSFWKRWSWLTHWYLGACLGLAPVAVAIALTGKASVPVLLVALAVCLWTAGFDILYSLQDLDFDRRQELKSVPARFGAARALWLSRASFAGMLGLLGVAGVLAGLGPVYYAGVTVVGAILTYEHVVVRDARHDGRSARINAAFFTANAYVSVVFLAMTCLDRLF
jgi:4-hydroxybenzoate polyprenyltransferase